MRISIFQFPISNFHLPLHPPALLNKSFRGSPGATLSNSFIKLRTRFSFNDAATTEIYTYWSPLAPFLALGTPFSFSRSVFPLFVPGGILTSERPSIVGTSILAPNVASLTVIGILVYKSSPRRSKNSCGFTTTRKYKSPAGAPMVPELPFPGTRTRPPFATPAGMRTSMDSDRGTRPSPLQVLQSVRSLPVPPHRVHGTLKRILPASCSAPRCGGGRLPRGRGAGGGCRSRTGRTSAVSWNRRVRRRLPAVV